MHDDLHAESVASLGEGLSVASRRQGDQLTLVVGMKTSADCVLHWGLSRRPGGVWQQPPDACWPEGTTAVDAHAVRTPLPASGQGERQVAIRLDLSSQWAALPFVVYFPKEKRWLKHDGKDFCIPLPRASGRPTPAEALARLAPDASDRRTFTLDGGEQLAAAATVGPDGVRVRLVCDADGPLVLHWGLAPQFRHEWRLPPEDVRPAGTTVYDALAVHTPFAERDGLLCLELTFPKPAGGPGPRGMKCVLYRPADKVWLNQGGKDLYVPLFEEAPDPRLPSPKLLDLAERIVGAEKGPGSWTLMHRFGLCYDLLDQAQDDEEALALLFAWLRYSAIRQLDWQRRYNTKPRELSHAQDRLTARLAALWRRTPGSARTWPRLLLTTLGRGGDGQHVRDEILHIMHRNHLKETSGRFIEEWHQKLHNNTTPDDVVICQAYLAFLRADGDRNRFYQTLEAGGVTRERLRGFERPIRTDPEHYPDRKDALIREFENFLGVLKAVHAGTDLESAVAAARGRLDGRLQQQLDGLLALRRGRPAVGDLAGAVASVREGLKPALAGARDDASLRDLLYLDLALEEISRGAIERENLSQCNRDGLAELVRHALRGLSLSVESQEVALCSAHWGALCGRPRDGRDWALHAKSVADRAARWLQGFTQDLYRRLQPKAEFLGAAFGVEPWTVPLFSEEVIRGGPAFALSLLLRRLDPVLRQAAGIGGWQVVSPGRASGRVRLVDRLLDVQGERFAEPVVLLASAVGGEEDIPEGTTAVITTEAPDLVSHVAVRARNAGVLFAACLEPETYRRLQALDGKPLSLRVTPGGDVEFSEDKETRRQGDKERSIVSLSPGLPVSLSAPQWVVTQDEFTPQIVGGKANNLTGLRGRLPDWIQTPASIALPFGAFEKALADDGNRELRAKYNARIAAAERNPVEELPRLRELVQGMAVPAPLGEALRESWRRVGLPGEPGEQAWRAVRRVWASQWNERAFFSRRSRGVPHDGLRMAVLIQQVVEADYAFVIHTANPLTGNRGEIYAEVVLGLGETLVGNYPGRALGFVCRKDGLSLELLSYPGKSVGLYGRGVIFRSDSNGEDLDGFAGAGLYDSVLAEEPERRPLDYSREKLVWDAAFRDELLRSVARVGIEVEKVRGAPQDVEGAVAGGRFYVVQTRPQVGLGDG